MDTQQPHLREIVSCGTPRKWASVFPFVSRDSQTKTGACGLESVYKLAQVGTGTGLPLSAQPDSANTTHAFTFITLDPV